MKRNGLEGTFVTSVFGSSWVSDMIGEVQGTFRSFRVFSIPARCDSVPSNSMKHHLLMSDVQPFRDAKTNNRSPVIDVLSARAVQETHKLRSECDLIVP